MLNGFMFSVRCRKKTTTRKLETLEIEKSILGDIGGWGVTRYHVYNLSSSNNTPFPFSWCSAWESYARLVSWESLPFLAGAATVTADSLHASGSLSNPLSLRVMVLNAPFAVVPLLSEPKLLRLKPSLDERPGVGEVGGESQLISRSGAVTDEVNGS